MSRSAGPGQPIRFKCNMCRRWRSQLVPPRTGLKWEATGNIRELFSPTAGSGGRSDTSRVHEYRCNECGHVGWSRHKDVARASVKKAASLRFDVLLVKAQADDPRSVGCDPEELLSKAARLFYRRNKL
jgi:hypothetical protein